MALRCEQFPNAKHKLMRAYVSRRDLIARSSSLLACRPPVKVCRTWLVVVFVSAVVATVVVAFFSPGRGCWGGQQLCCCGARNESPAAAFDDANLLGFDESLGEFSLAVSILETPFENKTALFNVFSPRSTPSDGFTLSTLKKRSTSSSRATARVPHQTK